MSALSREIPLCGFMLCSNQERPLKTRLHFQRRRRSICRLTIPRIDARALNSEYCSKSNGSARRSGFQGDTMTLRLSGLLLIAAVAGLLGSAQALAQNAYIPNSVDHNVSVIDTATNTVIGSPIPVGLNPRGVAVTPDGSKVYVANRGNNTVSVIATATNTVTATISVGPRPVGVAVTPDGSKVYVANFDNGTVSVIATATDTVTGSPIRVGADPIGVAVIPDGSKVYITNLNFFA